LYKSHVANNGDKAKATRAFRVFEVLILAPLKLRFDVKRCTFVKQSFGSMKFDWFLEVMPSLHCHNVSKH
jgi:hypothetical protein